MRGYFLRFHTFVLYLVYLLLNDNIGQMLFMLNKLMIQLLVHVTVFIWLLLQICLILSSCHPKVPNSLLINVNVIAFPQQQALVMRALHGTYSISHD